MSDRTIRRGWIGAVVLAVLLTGLVGIAQVVDIPGIRKVIHPEPSPTTIGTDCARGDAAACLELCRGLAKASDISCGVRELPTPPRGAQGAKGPAPRLEITTGERGSSSPSSPGGSSATSPDASSPAPSGGGGNGPPAPSPAPSPPPAPPPGTTPQPPPSPPPGGSPGGAVGRTIDRVRTTVCPHLPPAVPSSPVCP